MSDDPPFALYIHGQKTVIFELSDALGFDTEMSALAISLFEDGPDTYHLQALYTTKREAEAALSRLSVPEDSEYFIEQLPDEDWVAKSQQGLPPVVAGRFCIFGAHSREDIPRTVRYPIQIEAGAAFGTGHHGTTKGCLLLFDEWLDKAETPEQILDLGCGAGTLAIAAAKALGKTVLATDIDPDAIIVTGDNAVLNSVAQLVDARQADGFDAPIFYGRRFDLIFANILAGPLIGLAPDIVRHLGPSGTVILSGILDEQAERVSNAFKQQNLDIKKGPSLSGWTSLIGIKHDR